MESHAFVPFDEEGGLVFATRLPGSAAGFDDRRPGWDGLGGAGPLWVHLDRTRERAQRWLRVESGVDRLACESLLAEETRPRAQEFGEGLLVILRGINMNPGAEPDDLIALRVWLDARRVVTLRQFKFRTVSALRERAQRGEAPATPGAVLAALATGLAERMGPSISNLEEMLDAIEDEMLSRDSDDDGRRSQLATIRRQAIAYRRYLVPQRDALGALANGRSALLDERDRTEIRVAMEQTARVCEALEEIRDRAAVTQEEMRARHEARVGRTVYLLTIVATVALPLGFLTGLLGVNVGGVPLMDSRWGFWIVCGVLTLMAGAQVVWFRKKRWL